MVEEISQAETSVTNRDTVRDVQGLTTSSNKNLDDAAGSSKTSNVHRVSNKDEVHILIQKIKALPRQPHMTPPVTISRIPNFNKYVRDLLEPKRVSIGPYHRDKKSVQTMEKHKLGHLQDFLARKPKIAVEVYLEAMREMETEVRQCYDDAFEMSSEEFSLMLLLDGCFVLEYFLKYEHNKPREGADVCWGGLDDDLLQIENQIPYSVIHKLGTIYYDTVGHDCEKECKIRTTAYKGMVDRNMLFFNSKETDQWSNPLPCEKNPATNLLLNPPGLSCGKVNHLLHLYRLCCTSLSHGEASNSVGSQGCSTINGFITTIRWVMICVPSLIIIYPMVKYLRHGHIVWVFFWVPLLVYFLIIITIFLAVICLVWYEISEKSGEPKLSRIPSARELNFAGVTFKKKENPRDIFDITFENGVMEIPSISISKKMKIFFTNLLLHEQAQNCTVSFTVTSYLVLMDYLLDTGDDVAILTRCGSIVNFLPNDEEVALFFNKLSDYEVLPSGKVAYPILNEKVLKYINQRRHKYKAILVRDYFSNPWAIISFVAAIILLLLTATQTGFSMYPVLRPN